MTAMNWPGSSGGTLTRNLLLVVAPVVSKFSSVSPAGGVAPAALANTGAALS